MAEICISPHALYMIVSDDVLTDAPRPGKVTIVGLVSRVDWPPGSTIPLRLEKLTVLLVLTGGRGAGTGRIVCINEETRVPAFRVEVPISFKDKSPLEHYRVTLRIHNCKFPTPGAYVIQFLFENTLVREQGVIVR